MPKYHKSVAEIRLCDSDESCSSSGRASAVREGIPAELSDNAAGGKRRHLRVNAKPGIARVQTSIACSETAALAAVTFDAAVLSARVRGFRTSGLRDISTRVIGFFGFGPDQANNPDRSATRSPSRQNRSDTARDRTCALTDVGAPPRLPMAMAAAPSVETPLHRLFCVEYARMRSGMEVFGDARHWWDRAKNIYAAHVASGRGGGDGLRRLQAAETRPCRGGNRHPRPPRKSSSTRPTGKIMARSTMPRRCWT